MGHIIRPLLTVCSALLSAIALTVSGALPAMVALSANTTALVMGGTFHPLIGPRDGPDYVTRYLDDAVTGYLDPAFGGNPGPVTNAVAVFTPEDFFPLGRLTFDRSVAAGATNLSRCLVGSPDCVFNDDPAVGAVAPGVDDSMLVFGYSQSAVVASLVKRDLIAAAGANPEPVSFTFVANPMRPNGGILARFAGWPTIPILGISFPGASPTNSPDGVYHTVDVVRQYDGLGGDFPVRPLNLIATANALLGYALQHSQTAKVPLSQARWQGREGDTDYYLIENDLVPLLQPLQLFVPRPILAALDAPLRVIIEDAYNRDVGPGVPTRVSWWPVRDLVGMALKLVASVPVAFDNLTEGFGLGRVLGTSAPGAFGVGGPAPGPDEDVTAVAARSSGAPVGDTAESGTPETRAAGDDSVDDAAQGQDAAGETDAAPAESELTTDPEPADEDTPDGTDGTVGAVDDDTVDDGTLSSVVEAAAPSKPRRDSDSSDDEADAVAPAHDAAEPVSGGLNEPAPAA